MENLEVQSIFCGIDRIDITPEGPVFLAGYGSRKEKSVGVHDPLFASSMIFSDQKTKWLLITLDLVAIGSKFTQRIREGIEQVTGIPCGNITIACTHTHAGPSGISRGIPFEVETDQELQAFITHKILTSVRKALMNLEPVNIFYSRTTVENIGLNRNDPAREIDNELQILEFVFSNGRRSVLVNYGCHPTVLSADNLLISADLPGAARAILEQKYDNCLFIFTNSGAGNVSTRYTRQGDGFKELQRFGGILANSIEVCLQNTLPIHPSMIGVLSTKLNLPVRKFPNLSTAQKMLEEAIKDWESLKKEGSDPGKIRAAKTKVLGAETQLKYSQLSSIKDDFKGEAQIITFGDLIIYTIPGEPYNEIVSQMKAAFPEKYVIVLSYANDYLGYFPIPGKEADDTYETLKSLYPATIGDDIKNQSIESINRFIRE